MANFSIARYLDLNSTENQRLFRRLVFSLEKAPSQEDIEYRQAQLESKPVKLLIIFEQMSHILFIVFGLLAIAFAVPGGFGLYKHIFLEAPRPSFFWLGSFFASFGLCIAMLNLAMESEKLYTPFRMEKQDLLPISESDEYLLLSVCELSEETRAYRQQVVTQNRAFVRVEKRMVEAWIAQIRKERQQDQDTQNVV